MPKPPPLGRDPLFLGGSALFILALAALVIAALACGNGASCG